MKAILLAMVVVGFWPLAMAGGQMASMILRRLAGLFQGARSTPLGGRLAVEPGSAAPSYTIAITCPDAERDAVARKVAVRRAVERGCRPGSVRPSARALWRETSAATPTMQETGSRCE